MTVLPLQDHHRMTPRPCRDASFRPLNDTESYEGFFDPTIVVTDGDGFAGFGDGEQCLVHARASIYCQMQIRIS